jgi:catechol 2,3-dioxygenase-like lactoylglutathione lyase family enzyme
MPRFTGVSHIELTVRDADRSAAWYEQVLGMCRVAEHAEDEHPTPGVFARVVNVMHPTAGVVIGLIRHKSGKDEEFSEFRVGLDHLALTVETRDELEKWAEHLDLWGVQHSAISDQPYGSVLVFRDPDNIQLELFVVDLDSVRPAVQSALSADLKPAPGTPNVKLSRK